MSPSIQLALPASHVSQSLFPKKQLPRQGNWPLCQPLVSKPLPPTVVPFDYSILKYF
ncbi:MAG: hypothetical protein ACKO34_08550 [Vampirovibrionales bacterium]